MARWTSEDRTWGLKSMYHQEVHISRPENSKTDYYFVFPTTDLDLLVATGTTREDIQKILWRIDNNQTKHRYYKVYEL